MFIYLFILFQFFYFNLKKLKFYFNSGIRTDVSEYETHCPLQDVGALANSENVWLNIQEGSAPGDISYDIENKKLWMPFLG